jgi:hypothetical protein
LDAQLSHHRFGLLYCDRSWRGLPNGVNVIRLETRPGCLQLDIIAANSLQPWTIDFAAGWHFGSSPKLITDREPMRVFLGGFGHWRRLYDEAFYDETSTAWAIPMWFAAALSLLAAIFCLLW